MMNSNATLLASIGAHTQSYRLTTTNFRSNELAFATASTIVDNFPEIKPRIIEVNVIKNGNFTACTLNPVSNAAEFPLENLVRVSDDCPVCGDETSFGLSCSHPICLRCCMSLQITPVMDLEFASTFPCPICRKPQARKIDLSVTFSYCEYGNCYFPAAKDSTFCWVHHHVNRLRLNTPSSDQFFLSHSFLDINSLPREGAHPTAGLAFCQYPQLHAPFERSALWNAYLECHYACETHHPENQPFIFGANPLDFFECVVDVVSSLTRFDMSQDAMLKVFDAKKFTPLRYAAGLKEWVISKVIKVPHLKIVRSPISFDEYKFLYYMRFQQAPEYFLANLTFEQTPRLLDAYAEICLHIANVHHALSSSAPFVPWCHDYTKLSIDMFIAYVLQWWSNETDCQDFRTRISTDLLLPIAPKAPEPDFRIPEFFSLLQDDSWSEVTSDDLDSIDLSDLEGFSGISDDSFDLNLDALMDPPGNLPDSQPFMADEEPTRIEDEEWFVASPAIPAPIDDFNAIVAPSAPAPEEPEPMEIDDEQKTCGFCPGDHSTSEHVHLDNALHERADQILSADLKSEIVGDCRVCHGNHTDHAKVFKDFKEDCETHGYGIRMRELLRRIFYTMPAKAYRAIRDSIIRTYDRAKDGYVAIKSKATSLKALVEEIASDYRNLANRITSATSAFERFTRTVKTFFGRFASEEWLDNFDLRKIITIICAIVCIVTADNNANRFAALSILLVNLHIEFSLLRKIASFFSSFFPGSKPKTETASAQLLRDDSLGDSDLSWVPKLIYGFVGLGCGGLAAAQGCLSDKSLDFRKIATGVTLSMAIPRMLDYFSTCFADAYKYYTDKTNAFAYNNLNEYADGMLAWREKVLKTCTPEFADDVLRDNKYRKEVYDLETEGTKFLEILLKCPKVPVKHMTVFQSAMRELNILATHCRTLDIATRYRRSPFPIWLAGTPGLGKSVIAQAIVRQLSYHLGRPATSYGLNLKCRHWDSYKHETVAVFDDILNNEKDISDITTYFDLVSCNPYHVPMAKIEDKGLAFDSPIVLACSNKIFPVVAGMDTTAVHRRRNLFEVRPNPQFADHFENGILKPAKIDLALEAQRPFYYLNFYYYPSPVVDSSATNVPLTFFDFLELLVALMDKHFAKENKLYAVATSEAGATSPYPCYQHLPDPRTKLLSQPLHADDDDGDLPAKRARTDDVPTQEQLLKTLDELVPIGFETFKDLSKDPTSSGSPFDLCFETYVPDAQPRIWQGLKPDGTLQPHIFADLNLKQPPTPVQNGFSLLRDLILELSPATLEMKQFTGSCFEAIGTVSIAFPSKTVYSLFAACEKICKVIDSFECPGEDGALQTYKVPSGANSKSIEYVLGHGLTQDRFRRLRLFSILLKQELYNADGSRFTFYYEQNFNEFCSIRSKATSLSLISKLNKIRISVFNFVKNAFFATVKPIKSMFESIAKNFCKKFRSDPIQGILYVLIAIFTIDLLYCTIKVLVMAAFSDTKLHDFSHMQPQNVDKTYDPSPSSTVMTWQPTKKPIANNETTQTEAEAYMMCCAQPKPLYSDWDKATCSCNACKPPQQQTADFTDNMKQIIKRIEHAKVAIGWRTNSVDPMVAGKLFGTCIGGRFILCPKHFMLAYKPGAHLVVRKPGAYSFSFSNQFVTRPMENTDMCVIEITSTSFPQYPKLINNFISKHQKVNAHTYTYSLECATDWMKMPAKSTPPPATYFHDSGAIINHTLSGYSSSGQEIKIPEYFWITHSSFAGCCGNLLVNSAAEIVGMVVTTNACVVTYKEDLEMLTPSHAVVYAAHHDSRILPLQDLCSSLTEEGHAMAYLGEIPQHLQSACLEVTDLRKNPAVKNPSLSKLRENLSKVPAILSVNDPRNTTGESPVLLNLKKLPDFVEEPPLEFRNLCIDGLTQEHANFMEPTRRGVLSVFEAVNGFGALPPMAMKTSPGYPWTTPSVAAHLPHGQGKSKLFVNWLTERAFNFPSDPLLIQKIIQRIRAAAAGEQIETIWLNFPKIELTTPEKVALCKTRVVSLPPVDYSVVCRMFFGGFVENLMGKCSSHFSQIGLNVDGPDFDGLALFLGNEVSAGDFGTFDGSHGAWECNIFSKVLDYHYDGTTFTESSRQQLQDTKFPLPLEQYQALFDLEQDLAEGKLDIELIRKVLLIDLYSQVVHYKSHKYITFRGLPSGHVLTTVYNNYCQVIYFYFAWWFIHDKVAPQKKFYHHFIDNVHLKTYGDDNILNRSPYARKMYRLDNVTAVLKRIDVKLTSAVDKNLPLEDEPQPLSEVSFLSRFFRRHGSTLAYHAALKKTSIYELLAWYRKSSDLDSAFQIYQNLNDALRYAYAWGREFFDHILFFAKKIRELTPAIAKLPLLTFTELDQLFELNHGLGSHGEQSHGYRIVTLNAARRMPKLSKIKKLAPDVICFQEFKQKYLDQVRAQLPEYTALTCAEYTVLLLTPPIKVWTTLHPFALCWSTDQGRFACLRLPTSKTYAKNASSIAHLHSQDYVVIGDLNWNLDIASQFPTAASQISGNTSPTYHHKMLDDVIFPYGVLCSKSVIHDTGSDHAMVCVDMYDLKPAANSGFSS